MGNASLTPLPSELPPQARYEVLDGEPILGKIAEKIRNGNIKKIVVMTGAGVSVAAGIPDFRSRGTGLYSQLDDLGLPCPEAVFSIEFFRQNPLPFYTLAQKLFPGSYHPTDAHFLSVLLDRKGLLLRHYTQNIDNLERLAGLDQSKLVEAHGSFADVHCIECHKQYSIGWFRDQVLNSPENVERCSNPIKKIPTSISTIDWIEKNEESSEKDNQSPSSERSHTSAIQPEEKESFTSKRVDNEIDEEKKKCEIIRSDSETERVESPICFPNNEASSPVLLAEQSNNEYASSLLVPCGGLIKPDITFFGEALPRRFGLLSPVDLPSADLLIVLGTSLQVYPFAGLVDMAHPFCARLLINREPVGITRGMDGRFRFLEDDNYRDVYYEGECNDGVRELCDLLGWIEDLDTIKAQYFATSYDNWSCLEKMQLIED